MAGTSVPALAQLLAQAQLPTTMPAARAAANASGAGGAAAVPVAPVVILVLCAVAGVGTVLLLPSRREAPFRKIGGAIVAAAGSILAAILVRYAAGTAGGQMNLYFWIFSTVALVGAVRVITHTRPVYSALYFVLTVFAAAGLFVLLWAEFMAAALVLIYAGAILVTYVFVIMLAAEAAPASTTGAGTGDGDAPGGTGALSTLSETDAISREPLAACAVGFALLGVLLFVIFDKAQAVTRGAAPAASAQVETNGPHLEGVQLLGDFLFRRHLV